LGFALAGLAVVAIAAAYGFGSFAHAWDHLHGGWLIVCAVCELLAIPAYGIAYRALAKFEDGPHLSAPLLMRVVTAGFGPFAVQGGFVLDKRALQALEGDEESATVRVLGLGALEWALLAPAACIAAIVLLATGDPRPMPSLLWPWALAVPIGFVIGLTVASAERLKRLEAGGGRVRAGLAKGLRGVDILRSLFRGLPGCWSAWLGMAMYWALDIAAFYGALRFIGLRCHLGEAIVASATGYALTRRSMPFGGAGVTEALMTFALHWVGRPVPAALAATVVYRVFNFVLPALLALWVRPHVRPLLVAADRRQAAAPQAG
jgi:uncharacterized membrane protein YbhN (UPF0104 family)